MTDDARRRAIRKIMLHYPSSFANSTVLCDEIEGVLADHVADAVAAARREERERLEPLFELAESAHAIRCDCKGPGTRREARCVEIQNMAATFRDGGPTEGQPLGGYVHIKRG